MDFGGKTALVTGAGSGIGRATTLLLLERGANVVLVDQTRSGMAAVIETSRHGDRALAVEADVTVPDSIQAAVRQAVATFGGLDMAVNNAGVLGDAAKVAAIPIDMMRRVFEINVFGVLHSMQAELAVMLPQRRGAIVNTASLAGLRGPPGYGAYSASKHAVVALTKCAALDHIRAGVRINAVCPGLIVTPLADPLIPDDDRAAAGNIHPIGRLGTPEEVAGAIVWLLSDSASFLVGVTLPIDGGVSAG